GWNSRFLSFGGRLVMLKSVLTSLPVYALSFFKAPSARYGLERGRLCARGTSGSPWWRVIERIRDGGGELGGGWFGENVTKKVGDGSDTFFWTDSWVDDIPLCERFGRLFDLAENKSISVAERFTLGWGAGGEAWVWRQPLMAWEEEMLGECQTLLLTVSLQDHFSDSWQWRPDLDRGYTVRGAYQLLTDQDVAPLDVVAGLIWHSQRYITVSQAVGRLSRLNTCSSLAALLALFGL
ncbi:hypothetical protein TSUD_422280, partial [Trifolium subterraneum]